MAVHVRSALPGDREAIVETLASAFEGSPLTEWIVRRDRPWAQCAGLYFEILTSLAMPHGCVLTESEGRGAALWIPPGGSRVPWARRIALLPRFVRTTGLGSFWSRFVGLSRIADHHPAESHYYLEAIGVRAAHRTEGVGSALLQPILDRCDTEGIGAYLHTSDPKAIPFYERHGFVERERFRVGERTGGPLMHALWRSPADVAHEASPAQQIA